MDCNHRLVSDCGIKEILGLHHHFKTSVSLISSDDYQDPYSRYKSIHAFGAKQIVSISSGEAFKTLQNLIDEGIWLFGVLGYDLKNELEDLHSKNSDGLAFPDLCFFIPEYIITEDEEGFKINERNDKIDSLLKTKKNMKRIPSIELQSKISKEDYLSKLNQIQSHIKHGDIYEMNFCQEFYQDGIELDMLSVFEQIRERITTPFMGFFQHKDAKMVCVSPERYIAKRGDQLISQPIKGTARRGETTTDDEQIKLELLQSLKERTENTMIVDLVRNDLGRVAIPGSVNVEEFLKLYTFPNIHQLISRVTATVKPEFSISSLFRQTFPMGSMTGAPKYKVMKITDELEESKRGWYSGALGYINANGDFDFNVIIRSLLYNQNHQYLSCTVGGGITSFSNAESEYEECLVKLNSILNLLN